MRKFSIAGVLALAALVPMLMAPSGGFPSFPTFGAINIDQGGTLPFSAASLPGTIQISRASGPSFFLYDQSQAANQHYGTLSWNGRNWLLGNCPDNLSGCTQNVTVSATTGGVQIGTPTGGDKGLGTINAQGAIYSAGVQFVPITYVVSGSSTTRTSTTTLSCDANLTTSPTLAVSKLFHVHAAINWQQGAVTGNGIRVNVGVSGTGAGLQHALFNDDNVTNANPTTTVTQTYNGGTSVFQMTDASVVNNSHELIIDGVFTSASSGATTVCISWAQNASTANATTINATSELDFQQMN